EGEVCDHGPPVAEQVLRRDPGGVVEARVVPRPCERPRPASGARRADNEAVGPKHDSAQARMHRARQEPPLLFHSTSDSHPYPNLTAIRVNASRVVVASLTRAIRTCSLPGLLPSGSTRAR